MNAESNITESELASLRDALTSTEWNESCDKIKRSRNGQYPPDWYLKVIASGLIHEASANFDFGK